MIGTRRFKVIMTAIGVTAVVEVVGQIFGAGGWSLNGQVALLGVVGFYMGSKFAEKGPQNAS